jgi:hypothetical protein
LAHRGDRIVGVNHVMYIAFLVVESLVFSLMFIGG